MTEELKTLLKKAFDEGAMYEATLSDSCSFTNFIKDLETEQLSIQRVVGRSEQFYCSLHTTGDKPSKCRRQCQECKTKPKQ